MLKDKMSAQNHTLLIMNRLFSYEKKYPVTEFVKIIGQLHNRLTGYDVTA